MKLIFAAFFCFLFSGLVFAQNIKEYYIYCNPTDFQNIYQNYEQDIYIPITIKCDDVLVDNATMRIRGDGTRALPKKSLKVKLDGATFSDGVSTFNFNAEYEDKSYIQQYITSRLFKEAGHYCFKTEHVRLYLNDSYLGLYLSVENVDEDFLSSNNLDPTGTLYKATLDGASLSIYDNVFYHWESKAADYNFSDLSDFITTLNSTSDEDYYEFANTVLDYDKMINILAINMLLRNYSSYYHNYFMYHDINNSQKWTMIPWDLDKMFLYYEVTFPYHHTSKFWAPDNPFLERAIICDPIFEDIKTRIDQLHTTLINDEYVTQIIDSLEILLEPSVIEDVTDNITDVSEWHTRVGNGRLAFDSRYDNLLHQFDNYARSFQVIRANEQYQSGQDIQLRWHSTEDPNGLNLTYSVYYGTEMNLDLAGTNVIENLTDTVYTITDVLADGKYYWKVVAKTATYSIDGFDNYNFFYVVSESPVVVINEIFYKSDGVFNPGDWIELYNNSSTEIDLTDWGFQDENDNNLFVIPEGTIIQPNEYLVLCNSYSLFNFAFPEIENVIGDFIFGLDSDGELIRLKDSNGLLIDKVLYDSESPWPVQANGYGWSLELISPDLDNNLPESWQASKIYFGTPGLENSDSVAVDWSKYPIQLISYPNPFSDITSIGYLIYSSGSVKILLYNSTGQNVTVLKQENAEAGLHRFDWDGSSLNNGIYYLQIVFENEIGKTIKVVKL